jgi:hypothetical protein
MKHFKQFGLAVAMALVVACAGAASASATTIDPLSTAFSLTSTNSQLAVSGGGSIQCTDSIISGTTPATGGVTTVSTKINLSYTGCSAFGFPATVTVPAACGVSGASPLHLNVMYNSASPDIAVTVTITSGCTIVANVPTISCTLHFSGEQTIGNGTSGTGGIGITPGTSTTKASASLNNATVPSVNSSGGGFGCPTAGAHTGTLTGVYTVTAPSKDPGLTFTSP